MDLGGFLSHRAVDVTGAPRHPAPSVRNFSTPAPRDWWSHQRSGFRVRHPRGANQDPRRTMSWPENVVSIRAWWASRSKTV